MKKTTMILATALSLGLGITASADNHESEVERKLAIHHVNVKIGHGPAFQAGMEAYSKCLAENDYDDSYSVWSALDGDRTAYHIVAGFEKWAEFGEDDDASDKCWADEDIRNGVFGHMVSWSTSYARMLPDWSTGVDGSQVVKLHNFRVKDGEDFREVVGKIVGHMKADDEAIPGTWYSVMSGGGLDADYFVVEHFENFAAMDEDGKGANDVLVEAIGEEGAAEVWEDFNDALEDDGYFATTLVRRPSMGYSNDD